MTAEKITDLLDECLENIFIYLNIEELFNMALANRYFIDMVVLVFKRKYGNMTIKVHPHEIYAYQNNHLYERFKLDWIKPLNEYAFLRIFGNCILKLHIESYVGIEMKKTIQTYITNYCKNGVVSMQYVLPSRWTSFGRTFRWMYIDARKFSELSAKLISSVESLSIRCYDECILKQINLTLNHIKHLSLAQFEWLKLEPPEVLFPHLELLAIQTMHRLSKQWFQFIIRHQCLLKLGLFSHERKYFDKHLLLQLVTKLPKLKVLALNELSINFQYLMELLDSSSSLKHLRLYEGWWNDEKSFKSLLNMEKIEIIDEKWEIYADYRCAVLIRKTKIKKSKQTESTK